MVGNDKSLNEFLAFPSFYAVVVAEVYLRVGRGFKYVSNLMDTLFDRSIKALEVNTTVETEGSRTKD